MRARKLHKKGSITDEEYFAIEIYGKEFLGGDFYKGAMTLQAPCSDYENIEEAEKIIDEVIRRINAD